MNLLLNLQGLECTRFERFLQVLPAFLYRSIRKYLRTNNPAVGPASTTVKYTSTEMPVKWLFMLFWRLKTLTSSPKQVCTIAIVGIDAQAEFYRPYAIVDQLLTWSADEKIEQKGMTAYYITMNGLCQFDQRAGHLTSWQVADKNSRDIELLVRRVT